MSVTTLPWGRSLTAEDLAAMPDDGHRYELIDGALIVTPSPSREHQLCAGKVYIDLVAACPDHLRVAFAPLDVTYARETVLQPDILVVEREGFFDKDHPLRPLLAVEVLSPSTRLIDLNTKKARFEEAGCASYWVIDPIELRLMAWDLAAGAYQLVADVAAGDEWTATLPFPVTLAPGSLLD